ncbi:hypothetical protein [Pseudohoeflea coraliihabitans]|uniref:HAD family hydrolase n=1 Tax=Pseudohoeflea coraliihabitans TaxID=2860393 RepID=A0ABS6WSI4_9HYPH|nr:hypothetical protein [Pseudohoeflea sp. DP4N28-3]MBW3098905.1 hypothetical protein [Pseudohoeflea sp. DP4N28-3]
MNQIKTAGAQISCEITLRDRPLLVCDVDEVVLEFLTPFTAYLEAERHELRADSFKLNGNIYRRDDGQPVDKAAVNAFTERFFAVQDRWQTVADQAAESLEAIAAEADIVFLTAMHPRHHGLRRQLLDAAGLPYPMIATEREKGPEIKALHGDRDLPLAFIDDIFTNLHSVRRHVPDCLLINLMANAQFRALAPDPGEGITSVDNWHAAAALVRRHFGLGAV